MDYAAILMMTSPILKSAGFTKTQKSRSLMNETLFFLQIKKFINYTSSAALWHKILFGNDFLASENFFKNHVNRHPIQLIDDTNW